MHLSKLPELYRKWGGILLYLNHVVFVVFLIEGKKKRIIDKNKLLKFYEF